jgi:hypothetical protein
LYCGLCVIIYELVKKEMYIKTGWYKKKQNNPVEGEEEEDVYFERRGKREPGGTERDKQTEHVTQSLMEEKGDVDDD